MYKPVPKVPNFPEVERRLLAHWAREGTFAKLRAQNAGGEPWSFLDGPITANNPMGVHHAWGRSYKDMFQRYHAMNGRCLRYQNGFDCQGLWVEVEVEKEHGFQKKSDILDYGLAQFVRDCKERVLTYAARQTEQSIRLGYWTEWDDPKTLLALRDALHDDVPSVSITTPTGKQVTGAPEELIGRLGSPAFGGSYFTFTNENNYTIWAFLKKCHDEGFVYRGADVMPWCCRCGTGLSQMEVAEGRRVTSHASVFVKFPLLDREREALLVWTTTPWTLTSNVAAAVHPELTYLKVRHGEWVYLVAKGNYRNPRVQELEAGGKRETRNLGTVESLLKGSGNAEVLGELRGRELLGLRYGGPFDHLPAARVQGGVSPFGAPPGVEVSAIESHRVIPWEEVTEAEGTGIVHIAPGCGAEDHALGREHGLAVLAPLGEGGEYVAGFGPWSGRSVHDVTEELISDLRERNVLVAREGYPHVYPHCWRCKEELVFRLVDEWFIRMDWRDRIKDIVADIRWIPPDGEAREIDWLNNMGDWMISKKRFWGLALPIWTCDECEFFTVIGGEAELREKAIEGWDSFAGHTPHRPHIDRVKIRCPECGSVAHRIEDVGNPWLDAGIVPYSTLHYNTDRDYWRRWFPADFVVESFPGQFRNWFYALLAMSAMMERRAPFRVLLGHALVRDERGEEMHKSKGNSILFDEAAETIGTEVMRYLFASQNPTQNLNFPDIHHGGDKQTHLDVEIRRRLLTLWNCYSFFVTYALADGWLPEGDAPAVSARGELDRWILSRLQRLIQAARDAFEDSSVYRFMDRLEHFTDDFSNWYVRRSRRRFWKSEADADKEAAYHTLYQVLVTAAKLLAPILPFLSEELYRNLVTSVSPEAPASVHLCSYPHIDEDLIDEDLERNLACVIRTKNAVLSLRNQAKVKIRQPLSRVIVKPRDDRDRGVLADQHFAMQLREETNVRAIELVESEQGMVERSVRPNFRSLGPRYGKILKRIATHLATIDVDALLKRVADGGVYAYEEGAERVELHEADLEVRLAGPENLTFLFDHGAFVALDTRITPELERDGIARDFNRAAQELRKSAGLEVSDRITVDYIASDRVAEAVLEHERFLKQELLALVMTRRDSLPDSSEGKAGGERVQIKVTKASGAS